MLDQTRIEALRHAPVEPALHVIDGKRCPSRSGQLREVVSPIDGQVLTTMAEGGAADAEAAIAAARRAFDDGRWSELAPAARKTVLLKWAALIEDNALELAVLGSRDNGTEIAMSLKAEPLSAAATIRYYAEALDKLYGEIAPTAPDVLGLVHREPVGVVAAIVPWNFPLMIGAWKLGPGAGCGLHGGAETGRDGQPDPCADRRTGAGGGASCGRAERRHRAGRDGGRGDGAVDGCRCHYLHRLGRRRAATA